MKTFNELLIVSDKSMAIYCGSSHSITAAAVFSSGIYFEDSFGKILLLHDMAHGSLPFGIRGRDVSCNAKTFGIAPGMQFRLERDALISQEGKVIAEIGYRALPEFSPSFSAEKGIDYIFSKGSYLLAQQKRSKLVSFCQGNTQKIIRENLEDMFTTTGLTGVQLLEQGLTTVNSRLISSGLNRILGLGQGLTPSFDDFLTGTSVAFNYCAREWGINHPGRELLNTQLKEKAGERTNKYSAAYLLAAAGEGIISAIDATIASAGSDKWERCFAELTSIGGSSGADMMCGVVFAASMIRKDYQ